MATKQIKVGWKMKSWLEGVIYKEFGNVSTAMGIYHIVKAYLRWVPVGVRRRMRQQIKGKRLRKWT